MAVLRIYKKNTPLARKKIFRKKFHVFLSFGIIFSLILITFSVSTILYAEKGRSEKILGISVSDPADSSLKNEYNTATIPTATNTPTPNLPANTPTPTIRPKPTATPTQTTIPKTATNNPQYTAEKIGESTWKVTNVKNDGQMASAQDIFNALNSYRGAHGSFNLSWDNSLSSLAQSRADTFASIGTLDGHQGFKNFMNDDGFSKIGFNSLGENSAFLAVPMNGERIIKEIFGADSAHDGNQLDPSWQYIGVGINGNAVNINFGKNKR